MEDYTLWEIVAYIDGRNEANGAADKAEPMSNDEFDAMLAAHNLG